MIDDNGLVQIEGLEDLERVVKKLMTDEPEMRKQLQGIIRKAIGAARRRITKDAKSAIENDPRDAYKAVRSAVYKKIFGGQVNILPTRRRGEATSWQRTRKLDQNPRQRGGNRLHRSANTMRMESYYGADRGFVLRFFNAGTSKRESRYGNRGSIRAREWFGYSASMQMHDAVADISEMIDELINAEFKLK